MFHSHNETMNVWTHFLGSLLFVFLLYLTYALPVEKYSTLGNIQTQVVGLGTMVKEEVDTMWHGWKGTVPRWPITVFVLCAIRCLSGSAIFHNFLSTTRKTRAILQTLDYCGICILICGSYVPVVYYSFYHYPTYLKIHLTAVIAINVLNVSVMATPTFRYAWFAFSIVDNPSTDPCEPCPLPSLLATPSSSLLICTCWRGSTTSSSP